MSIEAIEALLDLANLHPDVINGESLMKIFFFFTYVPRFKNDILVVQDSKWPTNVPPRYLPKSVTLLLANLCETTDDGVDRLWLLLREVVWVFDEKQKEMETRFKAYGKGLSYHVIYPPTQYCTNPNCERTKKGLRAQKFNQKEGILYTLDRGACPAWIISLECQGCRTSYHNNYSVANGVRQYYPAKVPDIIEVTDHRFVETRVVQMWRMDMNVAWKSATNCARTYDMSLNHGSLPEEWSLKASALKGDHIYYGFTLLSLLEDYCSRNTVLVVPHTGDQANRFTEAVRERNMRLKCYGQPEIEHCCNKCMRLYNANGSESGQVPKSVFVVVMDGITLGHPCCAEHNCKIPLSSSRDRYCPEHTSKNDECVVDSCGRPVRDGKRTCDNPVHQEVERINCERGQSRFQLQERMKRSQVAHPNDGIAEERNLFEVVDEDDEELLEVDEQGNVTATEGLASENMTLVPTVTATPKKRVRARFGRKRTHNEQILVAPCGMILARETFYGAEAIGTCAEFIKRTFRINEQMPNHIFFDNNCSLAKHVKNDPDFKDVGLSVDVFHFNCKHSQKDIFCQMNCNPALFPELLSEDGKGWYFNSSIAEQTNVWLGGFHAIVREMLVDRYNFFLDEMIILRNRMTHAKLAREGHCPMYRT